MRTAIIAAAALFAAAYLFASLGGLEALGLPKIVAHIFILLPWSALASFGCYAVVKVGYGVATFPECPEAEKELQQDLVKARQVLTAKGFKFE